MAFGQTQVRNARGQKRRKIKNKKKESRDIWYMGRVHVRSFDCAQFDFAFSAVDLLWRKMIRSTRQILPISHSMFLLSLSITIAIQTVAKLTKSNQFKTIATVFSRAGVN